MTTREVISKLPKNIANTLESLRMDYRNPVISKDAARARLAGYVLGLRDAGYITESERKILFVYGTI